MVKRFYLSCFLFLFAMTIRAQEEVHMKVRSEGLRRIVLAVASFEANRATELTGEVRGVIIRDLELSGFFRVVDTATSGPYQSNDSDTGAQYGGASVVLDSRLEYQGEQVTFNARLKDIASDQPILDKAYDSDLHGMRKLGHRVADA